MPRLSFTQNLRRHVDSPEVIVSGNTLREVLESTFERYPKLRGYVLDDQGCVHRHMAIMINGTATTDRKRLDQALDDGDEIFVMQALSGG